MAKSTILAPPTPPPPYEPIKLKDALEQRYLAYALSTIMHRALPDVRDGLKPVHRRLLYAMQQLRLAPQGEFRKCAKIVGDTMGNFHPHGNQAIYDALARLAQDFSVRYPLVDGQGNFGNIDGDNPAADRYTEARLTEVAAQLLDGIDEDTVDFRPNYDGARAGAVGAACQFPQPARQWRLGHRRRHGDQYPAAQCRRAVRRGAASHQVPQRHRRQAGRSCPRARSADRRHHRRAARADRAGLQDRARQLPSARALDPRRIRAAAPTRSSSPKFRIRSRKRGSSPASPSCCRRRSCRCSPTCATSRPRRCGSCSSRRAAPSIRRCSWSRCSS